MRILNEGRSAKFKDQIIEAIRKAFDVAILVDVDEEKGVVAGLRKKYPKATPSMLAKLLVERARAKGLAAGFFTGLPANPWVAVPTGVADAGIVLRTQVRMACQIGLLYDETFLDDREPPYEVLVPIFGATAAGEFVREFAVRGGMGLTRAAIRKYLSKQTLRMFKRIMIRIFGLKIGRKILITKTLPIVGGAIAATWNAVEIDVVGKRVIKYFEGAELSQAGG